MVPPEHTTNRGELYESYQVDKLRKWAPVRAGRRTYYGDLRRGERGEHWRMMLRLLTRHGNADEGALKPQPFSLIVTIADPEKKARIYDEMAQIVRNRFQSQNLTVRTAARVTVGDDGLGVELAEGAAGVGSARAGGVRPVSR